MVAHAVLILCEGLKLHNGQSDGIANRKHHGNRSTRRQPEGAGLFDVVPHIKNDLAVCAERRVDMRRNTDNPLNPELS